jgi:hypothetical protein
MRQAFAVLLLLAAALAGPVRAQGDVDSLQQQLRQRDALIQDLLRRVEALERRAGAPMAAAAAAPPPAPAVAQAPAAAAASADEEDTVRALEQALVRQGGLVLPPRSVEVEPAYLYTFDGNRALGIVPTAAGAQVAQASSRRQRHEASLGLRVGLPWASQLTVTVPYVHVRNTSSAAALGFDQSDRTSGVGDLQVQVSRQLLDEGRGHPALLASLAWKGANGDYQAGAPSAGSGFASVQAALTAVKRQDPLVFFGGVSYTAYRARDQAAGHTEPGASTGIRLGTMLAASPQSSLRIGVDLARTLRTRVNGTALAGSETLSGVVELGVVSLFNKTTSLDVSVGFGVTPDAPRLRVGVALPIRLR